MAFALNTVTYAWETNSVAWSGSMTYTTPTKRIWIAETGSRTFLSVDVEMYVRDATNGSTLTASPTIYGLTASIDGNTSNNPTVSRQITLTGDHVSLLFKDDFTNLFNARFSGSNHDVALSWSIPSANAGPWVGHSFRLICTYQYDDDNVGRNMNTVALPLDHINSTLLTTNTVFGKKIPGYTNIPALTTFLPEQNKIIRDYWIEYTGNDASVATTNVNMFTTIDSGSESARFVLSGSLNSDTYYFDIQSGSFSTGSSHTLSARSSLASRMNSISPTLWVTYEYDTSSTVVMNSCFLPLNVDFYGIRNRATNVIYGYCNFLIPESNPSLVNSAAVTIYPAIAGTTAYIASVNGKSIANQVTRGSVVGSPIQINNRFDAGAVSASNITLQTGFNTIYINNTTTFDNASSISAYVLLNYSASALSHRRKQNKTIYFGSGSASGVLTSTRTSNNFSHVTGSIHSDITGSYYLNGILSFSEVNIGTEASTPAFMYFHQYTGSLNISASLSTADYFQGRGTEQGLARTPFNFNVYRNYPTDPDSLANLKVDYFKNIASDRYHATSYAPAWRADYLTFNQNKIGITGSLLNCNFTSSIYRISICQSGSLTINSNIAAVVSSGSGSSKKFYFDWYDNVTNLYAVAQWPEYGISNFSTASQGDILTIDFSTSSGGGETSHTWIG